MASEKNLKRRSEVLDRLHAQLQESLRSLVTAEDWQQALAVAAQFHDYSFANTRLIWSQAVSRGFRPTRVAGYRTWQKLGRQVRRGERGLQILAPVTRKVETDDDQEERRVVGFRAVHVFDLSQTDGEPLPDIRPQLVEGDLPAQWQEITDLIGDTGFTLEVTDADRLGEANGITDWRTREVVVRAGLPGAQRFKTAVHELAHIKLHEPDSEGRPNCRGVVEVEAESVAYMVCTYLGVDTKGYSLPYVAAWSGGDLDKVAATAERVIDCAHNVIGHLESSRQLEQDRSRRITTRKREQPALSSREAAETPSVRVVSSEDAEKALRRAIFYYREELLADGEARAFLAERGIGEQSMERWELGYAPNSWDSLIKTLRSQGVSDEVLLEAGVVGRARTGRLYDRMRGRIIFPVYNSQGSPRGLAGRSITDDGPKYLNSPETALYKKSSLLYGLHLAQEEIVQHSHAVIVEGYTDAIAAHQAGITNTVATGGTALTSDHLETVRPAATAITLAFDGDEAGLQAADRVAELPAATLTGFHVQVARLPAGTDPAVLIADGRAHIFENAVRNPTPLFHHTMDRTIAQFNLDEVEGPIRAIYAVSRLVERLPDPSRRPAAVGYLASLLGRDEVFVERILSEHEEPHLRRRVRERSFGRTLR